MPCCPHTFFQHGGAGGRCNYCPCAGWVEPPDPAVVERAEQAHRQWQIETAHRQIASARTVLRQAGVPVPGALPPQVREDALALLRGGARAIEVAEALQGQVSAATVARWAKVAEIKLRQGPCADPLREEAIRLHKEGRSTAEIAALIKRSQRSVQGYLSEGKRRKKRGA